MKNKILLLTLLVSTAIFAQKDEIKYAEKEFSKGNSQIAVDVLSKIEYLIFNSTDDIKSEFFFLKGNAYLDLANKNIEKGKNLSLAAKTYQELISAERMAGKIKYSAQVITLLSDIKNKLVSEAIVDAKNDKHLESGQKLYEAYLLDRKDTVNLYYAASSYINGKDFKSAIGMYEELKALNYSGKSTNYYAYNKEKKTEDLFSSANERDIMILAGTHERPRAEAGVTKRGEIYKNIALIYVQEGKIEKAKNAVYEARIKNPEDTSLAIAEANLYLQTNDFEKYKILIADILKNNPNDADLIYNLGVVSSKSNKLLEAEKYYKRTIEIDPLYLNAYINLSSLKLDEEKLIIEEMNKLGTSTKDMAKYKILKSQRDDLFKSVIPFLIKAKEIEPKDEDISRTLLSVYSALEMTAEYKALKAQL